MITYLRLSDSDLELCEIECVSIGGERGERIRAALAELWRLRAAKAADRDFIVGVVKHAIDSSRDLPHGRAEHVIATRVAVDLSIPKHMCLSDEDREMLIALRDDATKKSSGSDEIGEWSVAKEFIDRAAMFDRILSSPPAMDRERVKLTVGQLFRDGLRDLGFKNCLGIEGDKIINAIATRVADALAVPVRPALSDADRDVLRWIRDDAPHVHRGDLIRRLMDRLLTAPAVPVAVPVAALSDGDRDVLLRIRASLSGWASSWTAEFLATLDRLLTARPIPPLVRELVQRELCRVPPGEQHDWERQQLAEALEALP